MVIFPCFVFIYSVNTALVKVHQVVIAHAIASTMSTQDPTGQANS